MAGLRNTRYWEPTAGICIGMERPPIRTPDQRLRVFVSSTLQELKDERAAAQRAILGLRLAPVYGCAALPQPACTERRSTSSAARTGSVVGRRTAVVVPVDGRVSGVPHAQRSTLVRALMCDDRPAITGEFRMPILQ